MRRRRRYRAVYRPPILHPTTYTPATLENMPVPVIGAKIRADYKTQILRKFDCVTEYLATCTGAGEAAMGPRKWSGNVTLAQAIQMGINGWPEGRDRVEKLVGGFVAYLASRIQREEWNPDVEGHFYDIGRYLSGEPEYWMHPENVHAEPATSVKQVRILYNASVSCVISKDVIERRGAAISALADLLELAGHHVTIDLCFCVSERPGGGGYEGVLDLVRLKSANERVDLSKLMFWMAHPASLRKLAFASWSAMPEETCRRFDFYAGKSYSYPANPLLSEADTPEIYLGSGGSWEPQWNNNLSTRNWIEKLLGEVGVKLAPKGEGQ